MDSVTKTYEKKKWTDLVPQRTVEMRQAEDRGEPGSQTGSQTGSDARQTGRPPSVQQQTTTRKLDEWTRGPGGGRPGDEMGCAW